MRATARESSQLGARKNAEESARSPLPRNKAGVYAGMGEVEGGQETPDPLLCLRPFLPQADPYMVQHEVDSKGNDRDREVQEGPQVQDGTDGGEGQVCAQVQDRSGQQNGKRRKRQESDEEHDAFQPACGATRMCQIGRDRKIQRTRRRERETADIEGRQGGRPTDS